MTPKSIARVRGILFMMDANERLVLRNYLSCFESRKKGHKPKTLVLLDLLLKHKDDDRVILLFKKRVLTDDARRMVLVRLREKMLATLTLDVNIARTETYDVIAQARAQVAQGKIAAQLLVARGQRDMGFHELDRSIDLAKKYELFHDLVEMLLIRQEFTRTQKDDRLSQQLRTEITEFSLSRDADVKARIYFDEVRRQYGFKGLSRTRSDTDKVTFVKDRMLEVRAAFERTSASTIGYFYYLLRIEYHQMQGELAEASEHLTSFVQMVENNPAIRNRFRLATAYGNLAANEMWMHRYASAESYFRDALSNLRENSRNHGLITEYLFYAQFYSGNIATAKATLTSLIGNATIDQSDHRKAIRSYLMACVEFCLGNHGSAKKFLARSQAIGQDKEGWNIGSRILSIINAIEQEDFDHADSLILNLRQFAREGLKGKELRRRDANIIEMLVELRKQSYDFFEASEAKSKILLALYTSEGDEAWHVQTPELVCFHTWFAGKVVGKKYVADYSMKHIYNL